MLKRTALIVLLVSSLVMIGASPALAKSPSGKTSGSSITLVQITPKVGGPYYGDQITFTVSTSYAYPVASVTCSQNGVVVYGASHPMYWPNAWDDPGIFTLSSLAWTGGAASCVAQLKGMSGNRTVTLATTSFNVAA